MYEVVEKGSRRHSYNCSSAEECAITVFSTLMCYAATYYPELELCEADCTDMDNILENVTLVTTTINATVILRTYNKGNGFKTTRIVYPYFYIYTGDSRWLEVLDLSM